MRIAELRRVFRAGESELLNGIARLAIPHEDEEGDGRRK
jgi:hypothetical protein